MTAYEIYNVFSKLEKPEYYEIAILADSDIEGASKLIQECFECDKKTAEEVIKIMNKTVEDSLRSKGIEPLTREQMNLNNEAERLNRLQQQNKPKCPTCGSTNVKKISTVSKVAGASMFGLFSKTARSQFKCNNCGYKW